ncbi:MAG: hypothetical protein IAE65_10940 [Ignavibacteria bacterium]|nr:hypothetical protein [Ignavibacteria bacterium]
MKKLNSIFKIGFFFILSFLFLSFNTESNTESNMKQNTINPFEFKILNVTNNNPLPKDFITYILNFGYNPQNQSIWILNHLNNYKNVLNFNGVHSYSSNEQTYGTFDNPLTSTQISNVKQLMDDVSGAGLKGIYDRIKIENLCYGQKVDYEVRQSLSDNSVNDGFSYSGRDNNSCEFLQNDLGRTALHSIPNIHSAGYIAKDIFENMQHSDLFDFQWSDEIEWKIKPMLRIDSNLVDNNPSLDIVRIETRNFEGDIIDNAIIRARNFGKLNSITQELDYDGSYINNFNFTGEIILPSNDLIAIGERIVGGLNYGYEDIFHNVNFNIVKPCEVDFRVYWFGNAEVWFDKMTVEDEMAERLFNPDPFLNFDELILDEINAFASYPNNYSFFVDEVTYSNIPCVKYVYDKIMSINQNTVISFALTNYFNTIGTRSKNLLTYKKLFQEVKPRSFTCDAHEIGVANYIPDIFTGVNTDPYLNTKWFKSIDLYTNYFQKKVLGDNSEQTGRTEENNYNLNYYDKPMPWGSLIYQVSNARTLSNQYLNKPKFVMQPQLMSFYEFDNTSGEYIGINREPMNEEIEAQAMVSLAHGADGISWFVYSSYSYPSGSGNSQYSVHGMLEIGNSNPRYINSYGQNKWDAVSDMNQKLMNWKPHIDKIDWLSGVSVHKQGDNHSFIEGIKSIIPGSTGVSPCAEDNQVLDCPEEKYWEMGFFKPMNNIDKSKYLLMVNRRSAPVTLNYSGDNRILQIKLKSSELNDFNNWKITDCNDENNFLIFNKNSSGFINLGNSANSLGYFKPGEGKLYKIAPVMQEGGTFVTDEYVDNLTFQCKGNVINSGYDLTLTPGTNITFYNNAGITMNGGTFISGVFPFDNNSSPVIINGADNGDNQWAGFDFNTCELVVLSKTEMSKLKNDTAFGSYMVSAVDCADILINNCTFTIDNNRNSCGAIQINYLNSPQETPTPSVLIQSNYINLSGLNAPSVFPAINVANFGFTQAPVYINWNRLTGNNSLNGITLSNVTGGVVNKNTISGFVNGINVITSSIDLFKNNIDYNQTSASSNMSISAGGLVNMSTIDGNVLGGFNLFSNGGDNITSDNSFFASDMGYNYFYTPDDALNHYSGTFNNVYNVTRDVQSTKNCFYIDNSIKDAETFVEWYQGDPVDFNFIPYECTQPEIVSGELVEVSQYIIDTIWYIPGGIGGGNTGSNKTTEITTGNLFKLKSDSLKVLMRKRKFNDVTRIGNEILNTFPDSAGIINVIQPLYFATLVTDDSTDTKISNYKTILESLISTNGNNTSLVLRCNYFIQKCKVKLGEYQSALSGFQQIMQNFPYSWEGVVAGWDYSATQLLAGGGTGQGVMRDKNINHELRELDESDENKKYNEIDNAEFGLNELSQIEAKKAETFDDKITKTVSRSMNESKKNAEKELKKRKRK